MSEDWVSCSHCGAEIHFDARFCRECGASDSDGWSEEQDGYEDDFDYEQFVEDNFDDAVTNRDTPWFYRAVSVLLLIGFLLLIMKGANLF